MKWLLAEICAYLYPAIRDQLIRGLIRQGADVIDIGMVSTDQYYYACATLKTPGVMVTASHNPPEYSGFKMVRDMPYLLSGDSGIDDLKSLSKKTNIQLLSKREVYVKKILVKDF